MTLATDTTFLPYLDGLLAAAQGELEAAGLGDGLCYQGVKPGSMVAFDFGDDCSGILWTRLQSAYPSSDVFPQQDIASRRRGQPLRIAGIYEVGLVRAVAIPDNGEPIDQEAEYAQTQLQLADQQALLAAICGFFHLPGQRFADWMLGTYTPYGNEGGVLGGWWTVTARRP